MAKNDSERNYYLWFSHFLGVGPYRFDLLIKHFGSAKKAYDANLNDLKEALGQSLASKFNTFKKEFDPIKKLDEIKKKEITVLTREDKKFPKQLLEIPDPPICLYIKGDVNLINFDKDNFFAIVGTRKPTSYGLFTSGRLAKELAQAEFIIVSGLALGIDAQAHQGAISAGGKTIAVLGCGVDIVYPPSNRSLYEDIENGRGLIMSEFPPGHTVKPGLFVARNRIVSGLSRGVLVVEGAVDSGSLITARYALEQGKEVFALPSSITSDLSYAPNTLIKQGAKLVMSVEDILEEFNIRPVPKIKQKINLPKDEEEIFEMVSKESLNTDEIAVEMKIQISKVLNIISSLEIKGLIEKNNEGKYQPKL